MTIQEIIDAYHNGVLDYGDAFQRLMFEHGLPRQQAQEYLDP